MRYVNKYKIIRPDLKTDGIFINTPISNLPNLAGQSEIVHKKFVDVEVEKSINDILDYESTRFFPIDVKRDIIGSIIYRVHLLDNNLNYYSPSTKWSDADFILSDIKNQKNSFLKSFVRLSFYDRDINSNQNLLFIVTLFPEDIAGLTEPESKTIEFNLGNSIIDPDRNCEGYFLYYNKNEVIPTVSKEIYMRATFFNAKNGKAINFMATSTSLNIDDLIAPGQGNLYTKYNLSRDSSGYKYNIDDTYSNNVTYGTNEVLIDLYQIKVN